MSISYARLRKICPIFLVNFSHVFEYFSIKQEHISTFHNFFASNETNHHLIHEGKKNTKKPVVNIHNKFFIFLQPSKKQGVFNVN